MIKFNTVEGRVVYVNPNLMGAIEIAQDTVHLYIGDQWYRIKESEDEVVSKLHYAAHAEMTTKKLEKLYDRL